MKIKLLLLLALTACFTLAAPRPARADAEVSFDFFYDTLSPYGEWLQVGDYGYCWRPTGVDEDWSPYSDGYWSYTDAGWTWVSYEDYGDVVYHYGRWVKVEDEGWCWVPDYEWGPAWVSFRNNDDYVGWAPLPPEARYEREAGFTSWVDTQYDIGPSNYSFCHTRDFGAPVLRGVLVNRRENVVIISNTVNITNISYNRDSDCVFNSGPSYVNINRYSERRVPTLKLVRNTNISVVNNTIINNNVRITKVNSVQQGNQLVVIAPRVTRPQAGRLDQLIKPKLTKVVAQDRVNKGWAKVTTEDRTRLQAKARQEATQQAPEAAPARPVKVADLEVVPKKADPTAVLPGNPGKVRPGRPIAPVAPVTPGVPAVPPVDKIATENPAPGTVVPPVDPKNGKKGPGRVRPGQPQPPVAVQPPVEQNPAAVPDATQPVPVVPGKVKPGQKIAKVKPVPNRPAIVKPFNAPPAPAEAPDQPAVPANDPTVQSGIPKKAGGPGRRVAPTDPASGAPIPQNNAAQEAARQRQAEKAQQQAAARQRAQDAAEARQRGAAPAPAPVIAQPAARNDDAQVAARQRQAEIAQQQQAEARQRAQVAGAQRQQAVAAQKQATQERTQQQAENRRNQAAQATQAQATAQAAARQRQAEQAHNQAALSQQAAAQRQQAAAQNQQAAAQRQQAAGQRQQAAAERQQAIAGQQQAARARAQQAAEARQRQAPPPQQVAPAPANRPQSGAAPAGKGKHKLTPEEQAALKQQN